MSIGALVGTFVLYDQSQESTSLDASTRERAPGKFIELEHGLVHYQLTGDPSKPLLIFIHGGGITGMEVWERNLSFFRQQGYRILAYDLYGRGYSVRPDVDHTAALYRDQLVQLIDQLDIEGTFDAITLSMGAIVGLDLYLTFPDRLNRLVMIDPVASGSFETNTMLKLPMVSEFLLTVYWYPRAVENQRKEFVDQPLFDLYARRLKFFQNIEGYKNTNYSSWMNVLTESRMEVVENLRSDKALVIYGEEDPYFGQGQQDLFAQTNPDILMKEIGETGHMPQYERPMVVNRLVLDFLNSTKQVAAYSL